MLSAHQGGGELLRPMPLEITRCLRVPGAELAPPPPVRHGPGCVVAVDTPWPNDQACHGCGERYPRHVLAPPPGHLCAPCATCRFAAARRERGFLLLPVTLTGLPLFPSEI
jgi:hypothetical protein